MVAGTFSSLLLTLRHHQDHMLFMWPEPLLPLAVADIVALAGIFRRRWELLARRLGVARQGMQRLADALVRDRAAEYRHNPDHRRSPRFRCRSDHISSTMPFRILNNSRSPRCRRAAAWLLRQLVSLPARQPGDR